MKKPKYGFLHIGKTGGTTISAAIKMASRESDSRIRVLGHNVTLPKLFATADISVSFVVRDPIERFISAFNSRLRNGRPVYDNTWRSNEAISYLYFPTVNDLAESIESDDERMLSAARFALHSIVHLRRDFRFHLSSVEFLDRHKDRIYFACDTTTIDDNLHNILAPLHIEFSDAEDMKQTLHADPRKNSLALNESGRAKLRRHLAEEYEIYEYCKANLFRLNL